MKIADIRQQSDDELRKSLIDLQKEQFNLRFKAASEEVETPARFCQIRRDIARIKTVINQRKAS